MKLSVRIQHHPSRAHLIEPLLTHLADFADVAVIADPAPNDAADAWRTHRACLEALPDDTTHLIVLQEDAQPVESFSQKVTAALARHPESILLGFVPGFKYLWLEMNDAHRRGHADMAFIVRAFVPTVAIVYPREVVSGLLTWVDGRPRPLRGADDGIVAAYCRKHRITPRALVPCICDHDASLLSVGKRHRRPGDHRRAALL